MTTWQPLPGHWRWLWTRYFAFFIAIRYVRRRLRYAGAAAHHYS